jgi:uncharacterized protein YciI
MVDEGELAMFVMIYTQGPAWQTVKTVKELPFYREHYRYMKQVFANGQLLMGGPFLDNEGAIGILDVEDEVRAREIVEHDPFVLEGVVEAQVHPWHAYFNRYRARTSQASGNVT